MASSALFIVNRLLTTDKSWPSPNAALKNPTSFDPASFTYTFSSRTCCDKFSVARLISEGERRATARELLLPGFSFGSSLMTIFSSVEIRFADVFGPSKTSLSFVVLADTTKPSILAGTALSSREAPNSAPRLFAGEASNTFLMPLTRKAAARLTSPFRPSNTDRPSALTPETKISPSKSAPSRLLFSL